MERQPVEAVARRRFALVTLGSAGDLHPCLAIARALSRRGHEVCLMSQAPYRAEVEREGVQFEAICSERDHLQTVQHPDLWHPVRGLGVLWRHLCVPAIGPTHDALVRWQLSGAGQPLTVLASPLAAGARFFRDTHQARVLTVATAPTALRSCSNPMFLGPWQVPASTPHRLRPWLWHLLDLWKLEPLVRSTLTSWQTRWGTPELPASIFGQWLNSPDGVMALFPSSFCSPRADWPERTHQFGFPLYQATQAGTLPPDMAEFLAAGPAPLLFFMGSAGRAGAAAAVTWQLIDSAHKQGRRCIVLGSSPDADGRLAPGRDIRLDWTNLRLLLPRVAGIIHHGGIGTCAEALRAQTPQLILAAAFDQHQNGHHIERLKAGSWIDVHRAKPKELQQPFDQWVSSISPSAQQHASSAAEQAHAIEMAMAGSSDEISRICDWLDSTNSHVG